MAQNLKDIAGCLSQGLWGMVMAVKLLLGAMTYDIYESMFTLEGDHRPIFVSKIGYLHQDTILGEGLNFRISWFQYSIINDVWARP